MKIALDPYMFRHVRRCSSCPASVAELGYEYIELSPRPDFMPFFLHPRADRRRVAAFRTRARRGRRRDRHHAAALPLVRARTRTSARPPCATGSGRSRSPSTSAVDIMNTEFNGRPEAAPRARGSSGARWRSCCRSSSARASNCGWSRTRTTSSRTGASAVDMIRGIDTDRRDVPLLRAAHVPHGRRPGRRHGVRRRPAHPSARRRLVRPPRVVGAALHRQPARVDGRVHQHLDIGQGEVDWDLFFGTLERLEFDGIMTACVFAWEDRAAESSRFMREEMERRTKDWISD